MELHTIVAKLTGPIYPVGESNTDTERYENLEKYLELYSDMTTILCSIFSDIKKHKEGSIVKCFTKINNELNNTREILNKQLNNED